MHFVLTIIPSLYSLLKKKCNYTNLTMNALYWETVNHINNTDMHVNVFVVISIYANMWLEYGLTITTEMERGEDKRQN